MESLPSVSVFMPVREAALTLERAVASVLRQDYPCIEQIFLAIGPSSDATEDIAQKCKSIDNRIEIIQNDLGLTAIGLNKAATAATGDYLVRVDSHCEIPQGYVKDAIQTITRTGAGNVGGIQRAVGESLFQRAVAHAMSSRFGVGNSKFHFGGKEGPTDTVYLGVYEAKLFHELGGFDESLVRNQDYELNNRIRRAGRIVWFDPKLEVKYFPRSNFQGLSSQYFQYGKWKRKVIAKDPRSAKFRQIIPPLTVLGILASALLSVFKNSLFLLFPSIYGLSVICACFSIPDLAFKERLRLFLVFPTMHISWGVGFLFGFGK